MFPRVAKLMRSKKRFAVPMAKREYIVSETNGFGRIFYLPS